jgi:hypothetical protein
MIILLLIERELRGRARSRALYWTRFAVALAGVVFCLPLMEQSAGPGFGVRAMGHSVYMGIVIAAFTLCCCAGFVTLDSVSRERREGTLGLLWLTRVKALDVLLGSFGAAGIACVCALTAFLPVLMLPVLSGGVTGGEAFRTMLVLLDTLALSMAAGLWASAGALGWFKSARELVLLLLVIIVGPVFLVDVPVLGCVSPLLALRLADDAAYRGGDSDWYWVSLAAVLMVSWLLLIGAGFRLRRAMREGGGITESSGAAGGKAGVALRPPADPDEPAGGSGFTLVAWKIRFPRLKETEDPVRWLVRRQRGIKAAVWAGALIGVASMLGFSSFSSLFFTAWLRFLDFQPIYLVLMSVEGLLFGWAASRFFVEGRRSGELELLLTTPVGARTVVSSQWKELRGLFAWPVIILVACRFLELLGILGRIRYYNGAYNYEWLAFSWTLSFLQLIAGFGALIWAGLWFGLRARSQAGALVRIVLLSQGVPYVVTVARRLLYGLVLTMFGNYFFSTESLIQFEYWVAWLPEFAILFYYLWLVRWARRRLAGELRVAIPAGFSLARCISGAWAGLGAFVSKARNWPPAPER